MANERKPISKRTRFEVFKRDLFTCQYCSAKPPKVPLEIDHIIPVCNGGTNTISNLVTACFDCNRGKSGIDLSIVPESLAIKIENKSIAQLQYKQYLKVIETEKKQLNASIDMVEDVYKAHIDGYIFSDKFRISVKQFIEKMGLESVIEAMEISVNRCRNERFVLEYFCGVCWNKIKGI